MIPSYLRRAKFGGFTFHMQQEWKVPRFFNIQGFEESRGFYPTKNERWRLNGRI